MPDAGILATILLLVGLFLLGLEFFIPSFGMILIAAVLSLVVSFWSAWKAWWGVSPMFFWTYVIVLTAGVPGALMGAVTLIQKTSWGNRMILPPPVSTGVTPPNPLDSLIGKRGVAQTLMTPGGIVTIDGERLHSESVGMLIEPLTPVIVVGTKSSRIVVRPLTEADTIPALVSSPPDENDLASSVASSATTVPEEPNPLDFDIPGDYTRSS